MQLSRQFHSGRSSANHSNSKRLRLVRGVSAQISAHYHLVKLLSLLTAVEESAVLFQSGVAKVVALAAHRYYQRVITELSLRTDLHALIISQALKLDGSGRTIDATHAPILEMEAVPASLGYIVELIQTGIEGARSHFMKQGLPDVSEGSVYQGDVCTAFATLLLPQLSCKLQSACATTNDHDPMSHVMPVQKKAWNKHDGSPRPLELVKFKGGVVKNLSLLMWRHYSQCVRG